MTIVRVLAGREHPGEDDGEQQVAGAGGELGAHHGELRAHGPGDAELSGRQPARDGAMETSLTRYLPGRQRQRGEAARLVDLAAVERAAAAAAACARPQRPRRRWQSRSADRVEGVVESSGEDLGGGVNGARTLGRGGGSTRRASVRERRRGTACRPVAAATRAWKRSADDEPVAGEARRRGVEVRRCRQRPWSPCAETRLEASASSRSRPSPDLPRLQPDRLSPHRAARSPRRER